MGLRSRFQADVWFKREMKKGAVAMPGPMDVMNKIMIGLHNHDLGVAVTGIADAALEMFGASGGEVAEILEEAVPARTAWRSLSEAGSYPTVHVLGKYPGYIDLAKSLGPTAKYFDRGAWWTPEAG